MEPDHIFNMDSEILDVENKGLKLNALESLEMNRLRNNDISHIYTDRYSYTFARGRQW